MFADTKIIWHKCLLNKYNLCNIWILIWIISMYYMNKHYYNLGEGVVLCKVYFRTELRDNNKYTRKKKS